jgi:FMN-dependent oxidoreductase (nitrilotriacetate monooxygenase family)
MAGSRQIKLATFFSPNGEHLASWRHPSVDATQSCSFAHSLEMAQIAEAAMFDLIMVADVSADSDDTLESYSRHWIERLDPLVLISALAATTKHIGLTATASTTYNEPYHVARKIASIDHVSNGRAGWNVVTTMNDSDAYNYSHDRHPAHGDRYVRAEEFVDVVTGLWDTWEDDSFVRDRASGLYFRPDKFHQLHHKGAHFSVRGPLDVARCPQGRPVIIQAGSSEPGRQLSARVADVVFTQQRVLNTAQDFYRDIKQRVQKFGRNPDEVIIIVGTVAIVGRTHEEAVAKQRELDALIHPEVAMSQLSKLLGNIDLTPYERNRPLPDQLPLGNGVTSRRQSVIDLGKRENLTMIELGLRLSGARAHWTVVGTPTSIADQMEEWFQARGTDGFLLVPPTQPGSLRDFGELVVPELQRRGLTRTRYEGTTLRDHLGLARPAHPKAARAVTAR